MISIKYKIYQELIIKIFTLFAVVLLWLNSTQIFSQANEEWELKPDKLSQERTFLHSIPDEQFSQTSKSDFFKIGESKSIVNKKNLENGFLLIEELWQTWDGSNWINESKALYSYIPTDVNEFTEEVSTYSLSNNYPNPFNPSTKLSWQVPVGSWQTLIIYDVLGNEVSTLVDEYKPAGTYEVEWNASGFTSGEYFYQLKTEGYVETRKMILIK